MKPQAALIAILLFTNLAFAQKKNDTDKQEIKRIMTTFMDCLIKKDSVTFYNLFHNEPIVWVGVFKDQTQQDRLKKDSTKKNYFSSTHKNFYRSISDIGADEEKFYNIKIHNDESIATVIFDYSFWESKKKINWGKESWGLVKIKGQWKITSVIFSLEMESIHAEPAIKKEDK